MGLQMYQLTVIIRPHGKHGYEVQGARLDGNQVWYPLMIWPWDARYIHPFFIHKLPT